MGEVPKILLFCLPYLRRYWLRFALGILFGFLFGLSNGVTMGGVYLMLNRLDDPQHAAQLAAEAKEKKKTVVENGVAGEFHAAMKRLDGRIYVAADPWLPMSHRPLDWKQVLGGLLLIPLLTGFRGLMSYLTTYLMSWSAQRIVADVRDDVFRKINTLSLDFFHQRSTAELMSRLNDDAASVNSCLKMGLSDLVKEPSTIVVLFVSLLMIDWKLTLIALAFLPLCLIPTRVVTRRLKTLGRGDNLAYVSQSALAMESFQNVRVTKAYELGAAHARMFRQIGDRANRFALKTVQARATLNPTIETLNSFGIGAVFLYTIWTGTPFSVLGSFMLALVLFYAPFKKLSGISVFFISAGLAMDRLIGLFQLQPTVADPVSPRPLPPFSRAFEFRDVSFSYGHGLVLERVSFVVPRGHRLGLAGESGSGKSSLVNLMFRFYDPVSGKITMDGIGIDEVRVADLRAQMALVSQDVLLFDATVAENIGFGKEGATRAEIEAASKAAYAHDFIAALPQGYDTPLGERGLRLSGGQRQRIAIARAFVRDVPLLVLDEATASLDSQAEAEVQRAIDHLAENRTVVCVAHRLSTLRGMDEILVLEKGHVIERGGFDDLLGRRGVFTAMAARQSIFPQAA